MSNVDTANKFTIARLSKDIGNKVISNIGEVLKEQKKIYTSELSTSFKYDESAKLVASKAPHARATEFGFPAGILIPVDRLREWVKDHFAYDSDRELESITYAVRNLIYQNGIKPSFYMLRAIHKITRQNRM